MKITHLDIAEILVNAGIDVSLVEINILQDKRNKAPGLKLLPSGTMTSILKKVQKVLIDWDAEISIHTDGSCHENDGNHPGTFGLVLTMNNKIIYEYSNHEFKTTNNYQELSAIIIATQIGKAIFDKFNMNTVIYSDSQYSINTLYGTWSKKKNKELFDLFDKVKSKGVTATWVKAHNGLVLNEYADKLCELEYNNIK